MNPRDPAAQAYVKRYLGYFYDPSLKSDSAMGPGLYLATDPLASVFFAGMDHWAMLRLPLRKGARFLDLRSFDDEVNPSIQAELAAKGCVQNWIQMLFVAKECRPFLLEVFARLSIDLIAYRYAVVQAPGLPDRPETAFVLVSERALDGDGPRLLTDRMAATEPAESFALARERAVVRGWVDRACWPDPGCRKYLLESKPWNEDGAGKLSAWPSLSDSAFSAYAKARTFGAADYIEDRVLLSGRDFVERFAAIEARVRRLSREAPILDPRRFQTICERFGCGPIPAPTQALQKRIDQLLNSESFEEARRAPYGSVEKAMAFAYGQLTAYPHALIDQAAALDSQLAEVRASMEVARIRGGLPPTFVRLPSNLPRLEDPYAAYANRNFRQDTDEAYRLMERCLDRWEREPAAVVQVSECAMK